MRVLSTRIDIRNISVLINIQNLSVLIEFGEIISKTYSVDRNWSSIRVNKYPRHIKLIEFGVSHISVDNIQNYQVDRLESYQC